MVIKIKDFVGGGTFECERQGKGFIEDGWYWDKKIIYHGRKKNLIESCFWIKIEKIEKIEMIY